MDSTVPEHTVPATFAHIGRTLKSAPGGKRVLVRTIPTGVKTAGGLYLPERRFFSGGPHLFQIRALVLADCGDFKAGQVVQFSRTFFAKLYDIAPHDLVGVIPVEAIYGLATPIPSN